MRVTCWLLLFLYALGVNVRAEGAGTALAPGGVPWVGLRGPHGTGVYPDSKPPTTWDVATGKNVRWVVPLNGWGHGQPLVADGKVFLLLEPDVNHLFPRVQCLDLATGALLWEDLLDHLPLAVLDEKERAEVRKMAERQHQATVLSAAFEKDYLAATNQEQRVAAVKVWRERDFVPFDRLQELRIEDELKYPKEADRLRLCLPKDEQTTCNRALLKYGMWVDIYQTTCNFACIGMVFGAPIWCDGALYVATPGGFFAKYDKQGKRLWAAWHFKSGNSKLDGAGHDTSVRSPIIYGNYLISTATDSLVVLDRGTGRIVLAESMPDEPCRNQKTELGSIASPVILRTGNTDVLLTAGPQAYRLPDLKRLTIEGWLISGMQALVKDDERDVAFFCGSGEHCAWPKKGVCDTPPPAAVRYALDGDVLRATVLWAGISGVADSVEANQGGQTKGMGGTAPWLLYDQGRVYHRIGVLLDAATGRTTAGQIMARNMPSSARAAPATAHLLQLAGGHVYGWDCKSGMEVFTADGKFVAANLVPPPALTPEQLPVWHGVASSDRYAPNFVSYSGQFTFGKDCLVARALMHLYCFAENAR
jgi:hypothetical protein